MHNEQKFWLGIWGMVLAFSLAVIASITLGAHDSRDKWEKAVSNGAEPMVTTCALYRDTSTAVCTILAQNRK
jgi:hypothetical protein